MRRVYRISWQSLTRGVPAIQVIRNMQFCWVLIWTNPREQGDKVFQFNKLTRVVTRLIHPRKTVVQMSSHKGSSNSS